MLILSSPIHTRRLQQQKILSASMRGTLLLVYPNSIVLQQRPKKEGPREEPISLHMLQTINDTQEG